MMEYKNKSGIEAVDLGAMPGYKSLGRRLTEKVGEAAITLTLLFPYGCGREGKNTDSSVSTPAPRNDSEKIVQSIDSQIYDILLEKDKADAIHYRNEVTKRIITYSAPVVGKEDTVIFIYRNGSILGSARVDGNGDLLAEPEWEEWDSFKYWVGKTVVPKARELGEEAKETLGEVDKAVTPSDGPYSGRRRK